MTYDDHIDAWHEAMNDKYAAIAEKAPDTYEGDDWDTLASNAYDADGGF